MFSKTIASLKEFDNPHDFERMCADVLNALQYEDVLLIGPRGGSDGGVDITFTTKSGKRGAAFVTLRSDIENKFRKDLSKQKTGQFERYILFCTTYLTPQQKQKFAEECFIALEAELTLIDIEGLRSLLDSTLRHIRQQYLHISAKRSASRKSRAEWRGEACYFQERALYSKALNAINQAVQMDPYSTDLYYERGWLLIDDLQYDKAILDFEVALQFDYQNDDLYTKELYRGIGLALKLLKRYREALRIYEKILPEYQQRFQSGRHYHDYEYLLLLFREKASILCELEQYEEAYATFIQAIESCQANEYVVPSKVVKVVCDAGDLLFRWGRYEEAFTLYDQAIQADPSAYCYGAKIQALFRLKRFPDALAVIGQVPPIHQGDFLLLQLKCRILSALERYEEAITVCEELLQNKEADTEIYSLQGNILKALNRTVEAEQAYKKAGQMGSKRNAGLIEKNMLTTLS